MRKFLDECDYLIHLVQCAIHDLQPQELPEGMCFENVYHWGACHQVENLAFNSVEKLKKKPEEPLYSRWQDCRTQTIIRDIAQNFAAEEIRQKLQTAGIRFLEIQGTKIKPLYPQSDWRTMSDLDFIIDLQNLSKAAQLLEDLGYTCKNVDDVEVDAHRPPNINVELHTGYFPEASPYSRAIHSPFEGLDEKGQCQVETFYLYTILHIAKHYFSCGCGIRRVLDVYYLNEKLTLDKRAIRKALEAADLVDFEQELVSLAYGWFAKETKTVQRSRMQRHILRAGLHGSHQNAWRRRLENAMDRRAKFPKLKYFLGRLFGNAEDLRTRYPVLQQNRLLYPVCWLHRCFSALGSDSRKRLKNETKLVLQINAKDE